MAPRKGLKKMMLMLHCEWSTCAFVSSSIEVFSSHLGSHLRAHLAQSSTGEVDCLWRDCGFTANDGPSEFERHIYFHAFHTKLKQLGIHLLSYSDLGRKTTASSPYPAVGSLPDHASGLLPDGASGSLPDPVGGLLPDLTGGALPDPTGALLPDATSGSSPDTAGSLSVLAGSSLMDLTGGPFMVLAGDSLPDPSGGSLPAAAEAAPLSGNAACYQGLVIQSVPTCGLDSHTHNLVPELPDSFKCQWDGCERKFSHPEWFYRHVDSHTEKFKQVSKDNNVASSITCLWKDCEATCRTRFRMCEHLRSHTQERVVACPTCGGMFSNNTKLKDHITRHQSKQVAAFQCSHCSKSFTSERILRDHMRHHINHYKCPFCEMTCPAPSGLRNHIRYRHEPGKPFPCTLCQHGCKNQADLRRHMETHSSGQRLRCEVPGCDYTARTLSTVRQHYRRAHQGPFASCYKCHCCDKAFSRGSILTRHLRVAHRFRWPPGYPRFRYQEHEDGYRRVQLVRYETVELAEQLIKDCEEEQHQQHMQRLEQQQQQEMRQQQEMQQQQQLQEMQHLQQEIQPLEQETQHEMGELEETPHLQEL